MHLLVIGHTAHYEHEGRIVGWGPTVKEVCWLARAFNRVTHLACLLKGPAPDSVRTYDTDKVRFEFVPPAGGLTFAEKALVPLRGPRYVGAIRACLRSADVVQIRCPGGLGMYGMLATSPWSGYKWAKYAGNWGGAGRMAVSHRFQRNWLKRGSFRGPVTVNGRWPQQPHHVYTFDNPSLTIREVERARLLVRNKQLWRPVRLVFVGRTAAAKGLGVALQVIRRLSDGGSGAQGLDLLFDVLGDGPERPHFERQCEQLELTSIVRFHGWVAPERVCEILKDAHFILLPSKTEGWPKVLSEAMAYGVVPISSRISAVPQILAEVGSGAALSPDYVSGYVQAIRKIADEPGLWRQMVDSGLRAALRFTYERYLMRLDKMLTKVYDRACLDRRMMAELEFRWRQATANALDTGGDNS